MEGSLDKAEVAGFATRRRRPRMSMGPVDPDRWCFLLNLRQLTSFACHFPAVDLSNFSGSPWPLVFPVRRTSALRVRRISSETWSIDCTGPCRVAILRILARAFLAII